MIGSNRNAGRTGEKTRYNPIASWKKLNTISTSIGIIRAARFQTKCPFVCPVSNSEKEIEREEGLSE